MAYGQLFSKNIVNSDIFLDLPLTAQALYFQLGMNADEHRLVFNSDCVMRSIGASDDDMRILVIKGLVSERVVREGHEFASRKIVLDVTNSIE